MSDTWNLQVLLTWDEVDDPSFLKNWWKWIDRAPEQHVFFHPDLATTWTRVYRSLHDITPLYVLAELDETKVFLPLVVWK